MIPEVLPQVGKGSIFIRVLLDAAMRRSCGNTRRAFRSDLVFWGQWCRLRLIAASSTRPVDVAAWMRALAYTDLAKLKTRAVVAIRRYLFTSDGLTVWLALLVWRRIFGSSFSPECHAVIWGVLQREVPAMIFKAGLADLGKPAPTSTVWAMPRIFVFSLMRSAAYSAGDDVQGPSSKGGRCFARSGRILRSRWT